MRLLIAEDELDLAEALTVFFEKNHFSVDAVHNGFDAYEYASTGEYDFDLVLFKGLHDSIFFFTFHLPMKKRNACSLSKEGL